MAGSARNPHGEEQGTFPPERDWLELAPPPIGADFVGRTLARLRDAGLLAPGTPEAAAPELPQGLLATHAPPPPAADFVERTWQRIRADRADRWRRLLLRYEAPLPRADFVDRTLAALRGTAAPRRRILPRLSASGWVAAVAAAVLLLVALWPQRRAGSLRTVIATAPAAAAYAQSPVLLSHLLAHSQQAPSQQAPPQPEAFRGPRDTAWLWLDAPAAAGRESGR